MKTLSAGLQSGFTAGTICTCIKVVRKDSVTKGFTDHDIPLVVDTVTYNPTPGLERVSLNVRNNAEISNQEFGGGWNIDLPEDEVNKGIWDDAIITVYKVNWDDVSAGGLIHFQGKITMIRWTEDGFVADVQSTMKVLERRRQYCLKVRRVLFWISITVLILT